MADKGESTARETHSRDGYVFRGGLIRKGGLNPDVPRGHWRVQTHQRHSGRRAASARPLRRKSRVRRLPRLGMSRRRRAKNLQTDPRQAPGARWRCIGCEEGREPVVFQGSPRRTSDQIGRDAIQGLVDSERRDDGEPDRVQGKYADAGRARRTPWQWGRRRRMWARSAKEGTRAWPVAFPDAYQGRRFGRLGIRESRRPRASGGSLERNPGERRRPVRSLRQAPRSGRRWSIRSTVR